MSNVNQCQRNDGACTDSGIVSGEMNGEVKESGKCHALKIEMFKGYC